MQVKPAVLSSPRLGWTPVFLPAAAATAALTLQAKPGTIRYTDSFFYSVNWTFTFPYVAER